MSSSPDLKHFAKLCTMIIIAVLFFLAQAKPLDPMVFQIQESVKLIGLIIPFYVFFTGILEYSREDRKKDWLVRFCSEKIISGITVYALVLWAIGEWGVGIKEWAISNVSEVYVYTFSLVIIWLIIKLTHQLSHSSSYQSTLEEFECSRFRVLSKSMSSNLTERDVKHVAAHESGHALIYAALGCLPPEMAVVINNNESDVFGYTLGFTSEHNLHKATFIEWRMLVVLAGKVGEAFVLGESTNGTADDHRKWMDLARSYLSNHFDGIFYIDPQNKFEQALNEEKLSNLQCKQNAMLTTLFSQNEVLFKQLFNALLEKRRMDREDLIPYLSQVVLPKDFPLPLGAFTNFSSEWPEESGLHVDM